MKLTLMYTFWNGDDISMLADSVINHYDLVDNVIICHQRTSNKSEDGGMFRKLFHSVFRREKITLIEYAPNLNLNTKENERLKHNLMLEKAKELKSTHFILSAADHFYNPVQFDYAKKFHIDNPMIDLSLTYMITYYKQRNWCIFPLENYCMPFIHKLHENTQFVQMADYPVLVDPSVKVNTSSSVIIFSPKKVIMRHYSMIRVDIQKKFRNAAASIRWTPGQVDTYINEYENAKLGDKISYFKGNKIVDEKKVFDFIENDLK